VSFYSTLSRAERSSKTTSEVSESKRDLQISQLSIWHGMRWRFRTVADLINSDGWRFCRGVTQPEVYAKESRSVNLHKNCLFQMSELVLVLIGSERRPKVFMDLIVSVVWSACVLCSEGPVGLLTNGVNALNDKLTWPREDEKLTCPWDAYVPGSTISEGAVGRTTISIT